MKKTVLLLAAIFCMIMLLAGCPKPGDTALPTDVDADSGYPVMGNPVVERLTEYPTTMAGFKKVDTGKTLRGQKIYRLYGTYIFQVGDTYYLDGIYEDSGYLYYFTIGSHTIRSDGRTGNFSVRTLENVYNNSELYENGKYGPTKAGVVFEIEGNKVITFDGNQTYWLAENYTDYKRFYQSDLPIMNDVKYPTYIKPSFQRSKKQN